MKKKTVKSKSSAKSGERPASKRTRKKAAEKKPELYRYNNAGVGSFVHKLETKASERGVASKEPLVMGKNTLIMLKEKMKKNSVPSVSRWQRMNRFYLGIAMMVALVIGTAYATYTMAHHWFKSEAPVVSDVVKWEDWIKNTSGQEDAFKGPVTKELSAKSYRHQSTLLKRDLHKDRGAIQGHKKAKHTPKVVKKTAPHKKKGLALKKGAKPAKKKVVRVAQHSKRSKSRR